MDSITCLNVEINYEEMAVKWLDSHLHVYHLSQTLPIVNPYYSPYSWGRLNAYDTQVLFTNLKA